MGCLTKTSSKNEWEPELQTVSKLIILLVFILPFGCAIIENNEQPFEGAEGYFFYSCGPTDGAAFDIFIPSNQKSSCEDMQAIRYDLPWSQTFTRIYITSFPSPFPDSLTTYYFGRENDPDTTNGTDGWAGLCVNGDQFCIEANTGSIQLPRFPKGFFDAHVNIHYNDGSQFNGQLQLMECKRDQPIYC